MTGSQNFDSRTMRVPVGRCRPVERVMGEVR